MGGAKRKAEKAYCIELQQLKMIIVTALWRLVAGNTLGTGTLSYLLL